MPHPTARRRAALLAAALIPVTALAALHGDDPELLDIEPPYVGPGFRAQALLQHDGRPLGEIATAGGFESQNVSLMSWLTLDEVFPGTTRANDCWGYTTPLGHEIAIIGTVSGTTFVDVTNPQDPLTLAAIGGPTSTWRDIKVYGEFAYSVSEGGGGIQIFDMSQVDSGVVTELPSVLSGVGPLATHNVAIDEVSGYLYRAGGPNSGLRIYDLATPEAPSYVAQIGGRYCHDAQIVTYEDGPYAGRQIAFACTGLNEGSADPRLDVLDVTDKLNVQLLSSATWPGADYSHQAWLTEDRQFLYLNDEQDENGSTNTLTIMFDVSDIDNATYLGKFESNTPAIGHNLYTKGDYLYEANNRAGLQVFDISEPLTPELVAWFDTYPDNDGVGFNGLWNVFPYFESGTVIGSDRERGLFVWTIDPLPLDFLVDGGFPARVSPLGEALNFRVEGELAAGTVEAIVDTGSGSTTLAAAPQPDGSFTVQLPPTACGQSIDLLLTAVDLEGLVWFGPETGEPVTILSSFGAETLLVDNMEQPSGWTVGAPTDTATLGLWELGVPTVSPNQPTADHTPNGTSCWVTGLAPGSNVAGGATTLTSPLLALADQPWARISYWRWFDTKVDFGPAQDDLFRVEITSDGVTWVPVETVGPSGPQANGGWIQYAFSPGELVSVTDTVQVRFIASDTGSLSVVEAAIDDFRVTGEDCGSLIVDLVEFPVAAGGAQQMTLDGDLALAGKPYWLLGTLAGTAPGLDVDGLNLPLNVDNYLLKTFLNPNQPPLAGSFGFLDGEGRSSATFSLPPGLVPQLVGQTAHHAFVTIDVLGQFVDFTSNAAPVVFVP